MTIIDPLTALSFVILQVGGSSLKYDLSEAQKKILSHPYMQIIIFIAIVYFSTKNVLSTIIISILFYILIYILFNEKHKYNLLSKKWLYKEKIIYDNSNDSPKDKYKNILALYNTL
jgi:hypothetical protein